MSNEEYILSILKRIEERNATVSDAQTAADWSLKELSREWVELLDDFYRLQDVILPDLLEQGAYLQPTLNRVLEIDRPVADLKSAAGSLSDPSPTAHRVHFLKTTWSRYAAVVLLLLGAGAYYLINHRQPAPTATVQSGSVEKEIAPGSAGAVLMLADGSTIVLDSLGNGVIATQNGAEVVLKNGQLAYDATSVAGKEMVYNTMTTPKGRQFQIMLPDGTKVWLNAASSIRYPTAFTGKERKVEISGEAYFEVAKNAQLPFRVNVNNKADIEVLGTWFNVKAYENEKSLNTTLLEGSVKVNGTIIKPGQQAQLSDVIRVVNDVDINRVMAWKQGLFNFDDATLQDVMHQLERWYNIEVVYENGIPDIKFGGKMSRSLTLNEVLLALESARLHFRLEQGKKLVVLP